MPPTLLAPDRQATWAPVWILECAAFPQLYATRDIDVPGAPGVPFTVGESLVGGDDLVGGGSGPDAIQAYHRFAKTNPTVTRRLTDEFWGMVEIQDVTIVLANADNALSGDYRGEPFTLRRYDAASQLQYVEWSGIITRTVRNRGTITINGSNVNRALLEAELPKGGVLDAVTAPLAPAYGSRAVWLFGNVVNLPLEYVRDDQVKSLFDYRVCRGTAAAITGARRVTPGGVTPFSEIGFIEFEPYPGEAGVSRNLTMEGWAAGAAAAPDNWTLVGAGATVAKNQTQVDEGAASASLTRVGTDCALRQSLYTIAGLPLSWWRGREVFVVTRMYATVASRARLRISDGIGNTDNLDVVGSGAFVTFTATRTIDAAATDVLIDLGVVTGNTTVHWDNVRVYLKPKSWEEVLRPDLYPGYTALRFVLRQDDGSSLYQIVADVHGLQPERNPVRAARTLLSDATHGAGRAVNAASFDAAEGLACTTYEDVVRLDAPIVFLPFNDAYITGPAHDRSGRERHGVYTDIDDPALGGLLLATDPFTVSDPAEGYLNGVPFTGAGYVTIPNHRAFSLASVVTMEVWYRPKVNDFGPICEKTIASATNSAYRLDQNGLTIRWRVNGAGIAFTFLAGDLDDWMHIVGIANGGVLTLYRGGVLQATGSYTAPIATGDGEVRILRYGTANANEGGARDEVDPPTGDLDNFALYDYALSPARVAAHAAARFLPVFDDTLASYDSVLLALSPTLYYRLNQPLGGTVMRDSMFGLNGAYVGGPTLGVLGPLPERQGLFAGDEVSGADGSKYGTAVSFENNPAHFAVATTANFSATTLSVSCWYKPDAQNANSAICEKTVGGGVNTGWLLFQQGTQLFWRVKPTTTAYAHVVFSITPEDVGRWMHLVATYDTGTMKLYRNGVLMATGTYTSPVAVGAGDFIVGILGGAIYSCQGDLAHLAIWGSTALTAAQVLNLWTAGTWYQGGLVIDAALSEPRPAQDWLRQLALVGALRYGMDAAGAITCRVDGTPTSIRMEARDGPGDGERTLVDLTESGYQPLANTVKDVVVEGRVDLLSNQYLVTRTRQVSTRLDSTGQRIGRDRTIALDVAREYPTLDRVACRLGKRFAAADRTAEVVLHQEARQLSEGELVQVTDPATGHAAEVMEVKEVRKGLETIAATVQGWDEFANLYVPAAFSVGAEE